MATSPGSFAAQLSLTPPPDGQDYLINHGPQAVDAILAWDGTENSTLPGVITEKLFAMSSALPADTGVWLGSTDDPRKVEIKPGFRQVHPEPDKQEAHLQGWLKEVSWDRHTARLYDYVGDYVQLRFSAEQDEQMLLLATRYVEVTGQGQFNAAGEWTSVQVKQVTATRSHREPFDLEAFMNDPHPKTFDPDEVVTASEPFDVEEFLQTIYDARNVEPKESSG